MDKLEDINPKDKRNGTTPLHTAAKRGHFDMVKLLLDKIDDTNINKRDEDYETPYTLAVKNNHVDIVKMLIDKIDNANPKCTGTYTILTQQGRENDTSCTQ